MSTKGYTVMGWIVWQLGKRIVPRAAKQNRVKLGAAGVIALVLAGGVFAAKSQLGDDS